jgi:hypothetical protein
MTDTEPTEDSVLALAADFDAGKDIDTPVQKPVPENKQAAEPVEKSVEVEAKKETEEAKGEKPEVNSKESEAKATESPEAKEQSKWAQNKERKEKTWQEINAEKEALKAEKEAIAREKAEIQKAKAATSDVYRDKHGATKQDYLEVAKQLRAKGETAQADAAEKLAADLATEEQQFKQQKAMEERQAAWKKDYEELTAKKPELKDQNSELHKRTIKVIEHFPLLAQNEGGLKYAVRAAEIELQAEEFEGTKAEFAKLKTEYEKLIKKTQIGSGVPTSSPKENKSFDQMTLKEQEKYLEQAAYEHDRATGLV